MKFKDLKATLKNGVSPVYLIEGADAYLRESAFKSILSAAITNVEFNLDEFSGQDVKIRPDEIYAAFLSYPFLSDKRLVKINEFYPTASDLKGAMLKKLLGLIFSVCLLLSCSLAAAAPASSLFGNARYLICIHKQSYRLDVYQQGVEEQSAAILSLLPKIPATSSTPVTTAPPPPGAVQQLFPPTTQVRQ